MSKNFNDRAGRKIRIILYEVDPVSGKDFPLIDTANKEAKFRRPAQALYDFVWKTYEIDLANDGMYLNPTVKYLFFKENDLDNIKKMFSQIVHANK
jgi:hypothetical protein